METRPIRKRKPRRLPGWLTEADRRTLLARPSRRYPTGIRNRAIMATMLLAGLRCAETLDLKPRDVRLKESIIRVRAGKGDKDREVPIAATLEEYLYDWQRVRPPGPFFFSTLKGGRLLESYVRRMVKRYGLKAGLEQDVHPHLLRHTCASSWLNEEPRLSSKEVQQLLGHSRLATTELYLHVNPAEIKAKLRRR
jgi:site-specific recombinase XerD